MGRIGCDWHLQADGAAAPAIMTSEIRPLAFRRSVPGVALLGGLCAVAVIPIRVNGAWERISRTACTAHENGMWTDVA